MKGKSLSAIGSKIHRFKAGSLFDAMANYCRCNKDDLIALSYCYGFILHYSLDRNCHPYVYSLQEKINEKNNFKNPHTAHNLIELGLDSFILNTHLNMKNPEKFRAEKTVTTNSDVIHHCGKLIASVVNSLSIEKIEVADAETALRDMKTIQKYFHDETGIKSKIIKVCEIPVIPFISYLRISSMVRPKDLKKVSKYANIYNSIWKSPYNNTKRNESFNDLFELSKIDALNLINGFNRLVKGESSGYCVTKNISFLTGVEVL